MLVAVHRGNQPFDVLLFVLSFFVNVHTETHENSFPVPYHSQVTSLSQPHLRGPRDFLNLKMQIETEINKVTLQLFSEGHSW